MQIKREYKLVFVPVVITLESAMELQALLRAVEREYLDSAPHSEEEVFLDDLRTALNGM